MAKQEKVAPAPKAEKKVKIEFSPEELSAIKAEVREHLKPIETKDLEKKCKENGVDISAYKNMAGGLRRMNMINSLVGVVSRALRAGEVTKTTWKKSL